jgi:hypothetical protein
MATAMNTPGARLSKTEAVRRALKALGRDAKPAKLKPFIKREYGIEITPGHITNIKSGLRKPAGTAKPAAPKQPAPPTPVPPSPPPKKSGISLEDLRAVKELIGRVGAGQLRDLIELLAR